MGQLSFGSKFLLRQSGEAWIALEDIHLTESSTYEWKLVSDKLGLQPSIRFCGLLHYPQRFENDEAVGILTTPFHSGQVVFDINGEAMDSYIYPDSRKMTQEQYSLMLSEILQEAALCFEHSDIGTGIVVDQRTRDLSWAQWSYIQASFKSLSNIIHRILSQPTCLLQSQEKVMRRDRVKTIDHSTLSWLDRNIGRSSSGIVPDMVRSNVREDSYNTYENRVLKRQLIELRHILKVYSQTTEHADSATCYVDKIGFWLKDTIFKQVTPYQGTVRISQVFRKHPVYRQCFDWFERLNKHGDERIGLQYSYPLKETYALYEIWCYMRLVKIFREKGLLQESSQLYSTSKKGLFLHFSEHNESVVHLTNGMRLYYQRVYQYNSPTFYTFTQQMKPDIVIEAGEKLYILDPKYRVPTNIGTALGEMHKYRDGILLRRSDERAVERVFVMTPVQSDELRYYSKEFQDKYKMGAIAMTPGVEADSLSVWVDEILSEYKVETHASL